MSGCCPAELDCCLSAPSARLQAAFEGHVEVVNLLLQAGAPGGLVRTCAHARASAFCLSITSLQPSACC